MVTFSLLASVSFVLGVIGVPSCGCFGKLRINPWLTFAFDVVALGALWRWRPEPLLFWTYARNSLTGLLRPSVQVASGVLIVLGVGFASLYMIDPSPSAAVAFLRGESLTIEPAVSDVGTGELDEERDFQITVQNHTDRAIRLIGGTVSCWCVATGDLPATVPPRETRILAVKYIFRGKAGGFQESFVLFTDDPDHPAVVARVSGTVIETSNQ